MSNQEHHAPAREYLTRREQFIMAAMEGLLAQNSYDSCDGLAKAAIRQADVLIELLDEEGVDRGFGIM